MESGNLTNCSSCNISSVDSDQIQQYKTVHTCLMKYGIPVIMVPGVAGNVLCVVTLSTKTFSGNNTALLLTALALVDILALLVQGIHGWSLAVFDTHLIAVSPILCKIWIYVIFMTMHFSAWILVLVTAERLLLIQWPHRSRTLCSRKVVTRAIILTGLVIAAIDVYIPVTVLNNSTHPHTSNICYLSRADVTLWKLHHWTDMVISCLLPFSLLLLGNTTLIIKLYNNRQSETSRSSNRLSITVSFMLILTSVVFLITSLPIKLGSLWIDQIVPGWQTDELAFAKSQVLFAVGFVCAFLNHAINFVLYFLSGRLFREAVVKIICRCKCGVSIVSSDMVDTHI